MKIKEIFRKMCPDKVLDVYRMIRSKDYRYNRDHKVCFGSLNADKTFYVFREDVDLWGVYSVVFHSYLLRTQKVLERGLIPVYDQQNYRPFCLDDGKTLNLWYRYFEKPEQFYELAEVYKSKNVIISQINSREYSKYDINTLEGFSNYNKPEVRKIFNTYFKVSDDINRRVSQLKKELFDGKSKILGVAIRECYRRLADLNQRPGHPLVYPPFDQIKLIKKHMAEWGCDYVYILTDDRECLNIMQMEFGEKLLFYEHPLSHYYDNGLPVTDKQVLYQEEPNNIYDVGERTVDYLIKVELLACTDCLLSSISSAAEAAILRNDGRYEHVYFYDLGKSSQNNKKE